MIEPALAARPGRIDLALEIPLPDADGRRRLFALYGEGISIDAATEHDLVERSDGISGAFIKELMRQAWLRGALDRHHAPTSWPSARALADRELWRRRRGAGLGPSSASSAGAPSTGRTDWCWCL